MNITFNELRKLKDQLPDGSIQKIASELNLTPETVRNYFGGANYKNGEAADIHFEPGPGGGIVQLEDTTIFDKAMAIIKEAKETVE